MHGTNMKTIETCQGHSKNSLFLWVLCFVLMVYHSAVQHISATFRNIAWVFINVCFQSFQCVSWYDYLCNDLTNIKLHVSVLGINRLLTDPVKQTLSFACVFKNKTGIWYLIQGWTLSLTTDWMTYCMHYLHQLSLHLKEGWLVWRDSKFWVVVFLFVGIG
jgi:hypothetical protein